MNAPVDKNHAAVAVHKGLYSALAAAQADMGPALKDSVNPAFKSKYADLASVMAACLPSLNAHGIAVIQPTYQNEAGAHFVKTVLVHGETGETAECAVPLIVSKNDMQGYGSAVTYARRYGLMSMAGIAPEEDDGHAAAKAAPKDEPRPSPKDDAKANTSPAAINYLAEAESLPDLKARWDNLPTAMKTLDAVKDAKEAAKTRLTQQPKPADDLGGDGIPY